MIRRRITAHHSTSQRHGHITGTSLKKVPFVRVSLGEARLLELRRLLDEVRTLSRFEEYGFQAHSAVVYVRSGKLRLKSWLLQGQERRLRRQKWQTQLEKHLASTPLLRAKLRTRSRRKVKGCLRRARPSVRL